MTDLAEQGRDGARHPWVDIAKGLCIVLVVMMHATLGTEAALGAEGFLHGVVAFATPFRIPAFFLLSGLFLGRGIDRPWRVFGDRRVVHFGYFYLLWLLIQVLAKSGETMREGGLPAVLSGLAAGLVDPYGSLWFIYLLAVFSAVTKLLRRLPPACLLLGAALLQVLPVATSYGLVDEFCARYVFFVGGYLLAGRVFALAAAVERRPVPALAAIAAWAAANGWLATGPSWSPAYPTLAHLPGVELALGAAGAMATVAGASLLARAGGPMAAALRACGARSMVIYLAFFLPMAAARTLLAATGAIPVVGLACLAVTLAAVVAPLALERAVRGTRLGFLFRRPRRLYIPAARPSAHRALEPA